MTKDDQNIIDNTLSYCKRTVARDILAWMFSSTLYGAQMLGLKRLRFFSRIRKFIRFMYDSTLALQQGYKISAVAYFRKTPISRLNSQISAIFWLKKKISAITNFYEYQPKNMKRLQRKYKMSSSQNITKCVQLSLAIGHILLRTDSFDKSLLKTTFCLFSLITYYFLNYEQCIGSQANPRVSELLICPWTF